MSLDVVVVGSCNIDLVSGVDRLPKPGETMHGNKFKQGFGGKGANQCIAASRLGASVAMVSKVGNDHFGDSYIQNFKDHSIGVDHIFRSESSPTGIATILVNKNGTNTIVIVNGANMDLSETEVESAEMLISKSKVVICQLEISHKTTLAALKLAKKHNIITILNPAPASSSLDPELFKFTDILCPNETEAELITGEEIKSIEQAVQALPKLLKLGAKVCVITMGSHGCVIASRLNPEPLHLPALSVDAVDTTGAGDAFVGALGFCLSKWGLTSVEQINKMIKRACDVASVSVQQRGTQTSYPYLKDLPPEMFNQLMSFD